MKAWRIAAHATFLALASVALTRPADAQVVTGTITSDVDGAPVPGAVVTLLDSAGAMTDRRALTDVNGAFAVRAGAPGRYRLAVRAIGFLPDSATAVTLGVGETRAVAIVLRVSRVELATITIPGRSSCRRTEDLDAVGREIWNDIWSALAAVVTTRMERLAPLRALRYVRDVDPASQLVRREQRELLEVRDRPPFTTAPAKQLASGGFWRTERSRQVVLYAPDAGTLISGPFLATHCFSLVRSDSGGRKAVGLHFEPRRGASPRDVTGTLWVDAATRELRRVEFTYQHFQPVAGRGADGHVSFTRLPGGAWVDDRWLLEMPFEEYIPAQDHWAASVSTTGHATRTGGAGARVFPLLRQTGGLVLLDSARSSGLVLVTGKLHRLAGAGPVDSTTLDFIGTGIHVAVDSTGGFALSGMLPGAYALRLERSGSSSDGGFVERGQTTLKAGHVMRLDLVVRPDSAELGDVCPGARPSGDRTPLLLVVRNRSDGRPLRAHRVDLDWTNGPVAGPLMASLPGDTREVKVSDWRGEIPVCSMPAGGAFRYRDDGVRGAKWSAWTRVGHGLYVGDVAVGVPDSVDRARYSPEH